MPNMRLALNTSEVLENRIDLLLEWQLPEICYRENGGNLLQKAVILGITRDY